MNPSMTALAGDHRIIESALDRLAASLAAGQLDTGLFRQVRESIGGHYLREEEFLVRLHAHEPGLTAKLRAQHDETLELAARLDESLRAGELADVGYLARRFLAIAQHNMIEEERDIFPLAERCFDPEQQAP